MLLGAFVDAGADRDAVTHAIEALGVGDASVTFERVQRGGVVATWANVVTSRAHHEHRPVGAILELLASSALPSQTRARAARVFTVLAEAEGAVHGIDPADVELHEVGAVDAIVDVVGVAAALDSLGIDHLVASPIAMGHGAVQTAHGELPNPPPAVARLLAMRAVPVVGVETGMELATPTGVAVLVALADRFGAAPGDGRATPSATGPARPIPAGAPTSCRSSPAPQPSRRRHRRRAAPPSSSRPTSTT